MSLGSCVLYTVPFDCLPEEDMQLAWLDMRVDLTSRTLGLNVKVRKLPPEFGSHPSYVKSLLCCTFGRWLDIRLPLLPWQGACLSLLMISGGLGGPEEALREICF